MVRRTVKRGALVGVALALSLILAVGAQGAGTDPATEAAAAAPQSDEEILRQRAQSYWEARTTHSPGVMSFYAPAELGGPTRPKDVSEFGNVAFRKWEIEAVEVEGDRGMVRIRIEASFPLPAPARITKQIMNRLLGEEWIKVEGTWYKKPIPRGFATRRQAPQADRPQKPPGGTEPADAPASKEAVE